MVYKISIVVVTGGVVFSSITLAQKKTVRHIELEVGQAQTIELGHESDISISRKSIVLPEYSGQGRWIFTGLKKGFVAVTTGSKIAPELLATIKVKSVQAEMSMNPNFAVGWICRHPKISCHPDSGEISGITQDPFWFAQAQKYCHRYQACFFNVRLQQEAINLFMRHWLDQHGYQYRNQGRYFLLSKSCQSQSKSEHETILDAELSGLVSAGVARFHCAILSGHGYELRFNILQVDDQDNVSSSLAFPSDPTKVLKSPMDFFHGTKSRGGVRVFAQPRAITSGLQPLKLTIGGEALVSSVKPDEAEETVQFWKKYGLELEVQMLEDREGILLIQYRVALSVPHQGGATQGVYGSHIENTSRVLVGKIHNLGTLDLKSNWQMRRDSTWLGSIPILGPLFRLRSEDKSSSRLQVWVEIHRGDGAMAHNKTK